MSASALRIPALVATILALLLTSCPEVDPGGAPDEGGLADFGVVMGTVSDAVGSPLGEVTVQLGSRSVLSSSQGWFVLDDLDEVERAVVAFRKDGYVMTSEITRVRVGESSFLNAVMAPVGTTQTLPGSGGGTVTTPEGGSVTLPPGFAVDASGAAVTGDVQVSVTLFDPSTDAGLEAFPGEFLGTQTDGTEALLISFAFMDVSLADAAGNPLGSAPGADIGLTMPVPASMQGEAPATIPLWYFDEDDGRWYEEASATFDGSRYTGTVGHLSIWNCDVAADRSYVIGRVIDCEHGGGPVMGARVTVKGQRGWTSGETSTPGDGTFRIPVDSNHNCEIWPSKNGTEGERVSFVSADTGQTLDLGDICLGVPPVRVTLLWGDEPRDLDSHLTLPGDPREHLYYGNPSLEHARLDTDDTDGHGPEVVTLYELHNGTYRYCVHHYAGEGDLASSEASALMIVNGLGIYAETPPGGSEGPDDVWQVWDFDVDNQQVMAVSRLDRIVHLDGENDPYNP